MSDDGFSMHSSETPEQEAIGQGGEPLNSEYMDMTDEEMLVMAKIFMSERQALLKLPMVPLFTVAYALAFMSSCPSTDGMVAENAADGFEYFRYVLNNEFPGADIVLDKAKASFAKAWIDEE